MEYDLGKTKDDRDKLMEHYDKVLEKKQEELDSIKALDREKGSLGEIMAKATPSKQTGELKRKLAQSEAEVVELKEKLSKEEDKSGELKSELINLQKQMETKIAQHEREVNRTKLANQKVSFNLVLWRFILIFQIYIPGDRGIQRHEQRAAEEDRGNCDESC